MSDWATLNLCTGMRRYIAEVASIYARVPADQPIAQQRRTYEDMARRYTRKRPAGVRTCDVLVPDGRGRTLRLRVYRPVETDAGPLPCMVYYHGGGFALGSIESHDCVVAELALASSAVAISVDYSLAPEHPFPAAFEDAYAAWRHVVTHAGEFGIDSARAIVAGDSAGAALAVAVCLKARDDRRRMPAGQLLIYPVLTAAADLPSYVENAAAPMLTAPSLAHFWSLYTEAGRHSGNAYCTPLSAEDVSGLPPACIATANYDPARDDGAVFAARLRDAAVPVDYRCAGKLAHGYLRARAMSPAAATEFAALCEGARALFRGAARFPAASRPSNAA